MAELTPKERLQPSLLDRLTDEEPDQRQEPPERRVLSLRQLRASVLRDLAWLFNSVALSSAQDLEEFPLVAHSVLNFGLPDLAGRTASSVDVPGLERLLRRAILDYEPRILGNTVKVSLQSNPEQMSHNALTFEIEGELWAQPVPLRVLFKSELDLEVGEVKVADYRLAGER
jgi:type VI secretion system protein ImpF